MPRQQVYYFAKGHMGQYEDWWYLRDNGDGTYHIEHEWDHVSVGNLSKNQGTEVFELEEGLAKAPQKAVEEVRRLLGN